jgi:large subunit ribosomal protein L30
MKKLKVTLKKSFYGCIPKHRGTIKGLGLRKMNQTVIVEDRPEIRGMLNQIGYLLEVQEN